MANTVAIIGSFQKYYDDILDIIQIFKSSGLFVLSPKESYISRRIEDFVIFETDNKNYSPEEIQMITLNKIISADYVYVYNPKGYVGRTTCYEIGFCLSKKKSLFFYEKPEDIPIPIIEKKQILKPKVFADYATNHNPTFFTNYNMCPESEKALNDILEIKSETKLTKSKKIVICGSMMFFKDMVKCQLQLESYGIESIVPKEESFVIKNFDEQQFMDFKKKVSRNYLKKIREKDTMGVLIYNAAKRGLDNYIGPNTLVELAMAFTWNRKIFLYNDIYSPLSDELKAWGCICLNGDLRRLINEVSSIETTNSEQSENIQLSFFRNT